MNWEDAMKSPASEVADDDKGLAKDHAFQRTRKDIKAIEKSKTLVITSAQNNTPVQADFLAALERYCADRNARLVVRPIRYKNPTSKRDPQEGDRGDYWWADELEPYLIDDALVLSDHLVMPDMRIQATALRPLTGLDSRSKGASAIYGATQLQMRTVPTPQSELPKILYTTGAVTEKNYSTTKQGNLASFHHSNSAIVVEKRGKRFHMREIVWDGETFIDIDQQYTADSNFAAPPAEALIMGDEHVWFKDPEFYAATYANDDSMVNAMQPKRLVHHDVFDAFSISPHHEQDKEHFTKIIKTREGWGSLRRELDDTIRHIDGTTPTYDHFMEHVVCPSNHHDHLTQFLSGGERNATPENVELYHWFKYKMLNAAEMRPNGPWFPHPLKMYCDDRTLNPCRFLDTDESYVVGNIELGMHGHLGPNGSRGGPINLSKIGIRFVSGHIHSPCIFQGGYWVGTGSLLKLPYTKGPSSWLHTNVALLANMKRQMQHVIGGHWRG